MSLKPNALLCICFLFCRNPINGVKELKPPPPPPPTPPPSEPDEDDEDADTAARRVAVPVVLTPHHTAYWQEGRGEGGDKPWKFKCTCGETCSSYENYRYHPVGAMFECSNPLCRLWSHVACVLGPAVTEQDVEEMTVSESF
jgi:hypothetical protein